MSRSRSPLTREQRRAIRAMAANLTDAQLAAHARDERYMSAQQQAAAMLWTRLDKFRRRHKRDSARD